MLLLKMFRLFFLFFFFSILLKVLWYCVRGCIGFWSETPGPVHWAFYQKENRLKMKVECFVLVSPSSGVMLPPSPPRSSTPFSSALVIRFRCVLSLLRVTVEVELWTKKEKKKKKADITFILMSLPRGEWYHSVQFCDVLHLFFFSSSVDQLEEPFCWSDEARFRRRRRGRGVKAAETKHADCRLVTQTGAGSSLILVAVLINRHASFHCYRLFFS